MPRVRRSSTQERAKLRTAALLALYTLKFSVPSVVVVEPLRMIDPPSLISGSAF